MPKASAMSLPAFVIVLLSCVAVNTALAMPVSGRVLGPDGTPVPGANVVVTLSSGSDFATAKTDETGRFTFELMPFTAIAGYLGRVVAVGPDLALGAVIWNGQQKGVTMRFNPAQGGQFYDWGDEER